MGQTGQGLRGFFLIEHIFLKRYIYRVDLFLWKFLTALFELRARISASGKRWINSVLAQAHCVPTLLSGAAGAASPNCGGGVASGAGEGGFLFSSPFENLETSVGQKIKPAYFTNIIYIQQKCSFYYANIIRKYVHSRMYCTISTFTLYNCTNVLVWILNVYPKLHPKSNFRRVLRLYCIQKQTWNMGPYEYVGVYYNIILRRLQSRLHHIYHGSRGIIRTVK
jgi:hypothetical protein